MFHFVVVRCAAVAVVNETIAALDNRIDALR